MKTHPPDCARSASLLLLLGAGLTCLLGGCATVDSHNKSASKTKWSLFQSGSGAFAVLMPGTPIETITDQQTTNAPAIKVHQFIVDPDSSTEFGVTYHDFPASLPYLHLVGTKWYFDTVQEGVLRKFNAQLISSNDMTFRDYPTREFKFEDTDKGLSYDMRLIVVGHRQYQLMVVSEIGTDVSKDKETFFNSLFVSF